VVVEDPFTIIIRCVEAGWVDHAPPTRPAAFGEDDLRRANRGGARISAREVASILERRRAIERGLRAIDPRASLAGPARTIPWLPLEGLMDAFAGIKGVGMSKMTKALHSKRPALVPILDSVVQAYLADDDPGVQAAFAERALALVRGYKRDLDANRRALGEIRRELARHGHSITGVRVLDLLIWSVEAER
jgi:hypothetical protein